MRESSAASRAAGIVAPSSTSSRCRDASARFQVETTSASTDRTRRARSAAARFSSALETRTMARGPIGIVSPRDRCLSVPSWVGSSMSAPPSSASAGRPSRLVLRTRPAAARPRASAARSSAELDTFARSDDSSGKGAGGGRSPAAPISACGDSPTRKASAAPAARLSAAAVNTSARALAASASARTTSTRGTRPASKRSRTAPAVRPSRSTRALARDSSSSSASSLSHAAVTASRARSTAASARADVFTAAAERRAAGAALAFLVGLSPQAEIGAAGERPPPAPLPELSSLLAKVSSSAELRAADARGRAAAGRGRRTRREGLPALALEGGADIDDPTQEGTDKHLSLGLTIPIGPRAMVLVSSAEEKRAAADRARLVRSVEAEVVSTWNRAEASRQRLEVLDGATIPAAREAAELSRIAYQEGRLDLLRLLESERTLADIRANRIETWVLWGSQRASLERLVGGGL